MKNIFLIPFIFLMLNINLVFGDDVKLNSKLIDLTNTLTDSQKISIEKRLNYISTHDSKPDIRVILTNTSDNKNINDLATNLFNFYKFGDNPQNNGLLILIAKDDKKYTIKPGLGIENIFKKTEVRDVADFCFKNNFKNGDFYTGITCGINKSNLAITQYNKNSTLEDTNYTYFDKIMFYIFLTFILLSIAYLLALFWGRDKDIEESKFKAKKKGSIKQFPFLKPDYNKSKIIKTTNRQNNQNYSSSCNNFEGEKQSEPSSLINDIATVGTIAYLTTEYYNSSPSSYSSDSYSDSGSTSSDSGDSGGW